MRSTSLLIVLLGLTGCATSQDTKGVSPPTLDSIVEVNRALQGYALMGVDDVPMLVGPQR
jgi:hypothetical protein